MEDFKDIFSKSTCYRVELSLPGTHRQVSDDQIGNEKNSIVRTDADPDEVVISKDILGSTEFEHVKAIDEAIRSFVRSRSFNSRKRLKFLARGTYLISDPLLEETDDEVQRLIKKRHNAIAAFMKAYPSIIEEKRDKLKSLFNENEFPNVGKLQASFGESIQLFNFSVPGKLESLNQKLFKRESEKAKAMWQSAAVEIRNGLREGFTELIKRAVQTLGKDANGRKKRFHESTVEQIIEFIELFDKKDITNDKGLADLVKTAKKVFKDDSAREIWAKAGDNEDFRSQLKSNFDQIYAKIETLAESDDDRRVEV